MAGIVRFRNIQKVMGRLCLSSMARTQTSRVQIAQNSCRTVGTSSTQKSETCTTTVTTPTTEVCTTTKTEKKQKYWQSFGFCDDSEEHDKYLAHLAFFVSVSILLTGGAYLLAYLPDFRMKDWYLREGYLELRRRESLGLPHIDPNLIDPAKVNLPADEDLKNEDIII